MCNKGPVHPGNDVNAEWRKCKLEKQDGAAGGFD